MKIVKIGNVSSEQELRSVYQSAQGDQVLEAAEFLTSIDRIERYGFAGEQKRWRAASLDSAVKIFVANPSPATGETTLWAAIALDAAAKSVTLLKIVNTYAGGDREGEELLADALHRKANGQML